MGLKVFEKQRANNAQVTELGRIRLGQKVTKTGRNGEYTAPEKLREFRFTSPHKHLIEALAEKHGGEVVECDPTTALKGQWEVVTDATQLNAIILTSHDASQWMEFYNQKDGCIRRCNQIRMVNPADARTKSKIPSDPDEQEEASAWESPCLCERLRAEAEAGGPAFDESKQGCKAVTRLSVFLPHIPGLGTWRLETKGEYAKSGIPDAIAFIKQFLPPDVAWIPVTITLELRKEKVTQADGKVIDAEFVVPVITTPFSMGDMVSGQLGAKIAEFGRSLGTSPLSSLTPGAPALAPVNPVTPVADVVSEHVGDYQRHQVQSEEVQDAVFVEDPGTSRTPPPDMTPEETAKWSYKMCGIGRDDVSDLTEMLKKTGVEIALNGFIFARAQAGDSNVEEVKAAIKMLNPSAFAEPAAPPTESSELDPFAAKPGDNPFATTQESLGGLG